jgi:hypothetical protein
MAKKISRNLTFSTTEVICEKGMEVVVTCLNNLKISNDWLEKERN